MTESLTAGLRERRDRDQFELPGLLESEILDPATAGPGTEQLPGQQWQPGLHQRSLQLSVFA
jgi:hypothetical protein